MADQYLMRFYETSAKTDINVKDMFINLARDILIRNQIKEELHKQAKEKGTKIKDTPAKLEMANAKKKFFQFFVLCCVICFTIKSFNRIETPSHYAQHPTSFVQYGRHQMCVSFTIGNFPNITDPCHEAFFSLVTKQNFIFVSKQYILLNDNQLCVSPFFLFLNPPWEVEFNSYKKNKKKKCNNAKTSGIKIEDKTLAPIFSNLASLTIRPTKFPGLSVVASTKGDTNDEEQ
ncbi:hypothetical protein RFI_00020 [Reticulomyxa filosa]|uniref:Uncharacterized protein n=1 Tax=Reticulomyxa filosa TaxID=46433 RepID=X6PG10_RETFI|nr:hypothetical protein RFI_00020 [Reticulomyxa filosa]|eukprot:ETO37043.1 hypothetical protein RFI_00020 [Reticulomyxa filosa]